VQEEEGILSLLSLLVDLDVDVHVKGEAKIIWSPQSNGTFSIKSLCKKMLRSYGSYIPAKAIWKSKAPLKACFLAWAASKGKVPTEIALTRRKFNLASKCAMCLEEEELVDYLFIHCQWVFSLWSFAFFLMGITRVQPSNVKDVW